MTALADPRAKASPIYLDFNATAPLRPEARTAMLAALDHVGNPSSVHQFGRRSRRFVESARQAVAALVGAAPAQVIFTGSATEANALALTGLGAVHVLAGATEHLSVLEAAPAMRLPVDDHGLVDLATLERMLAGCDGPKIVSVMYVNNETGVIQPISEVAAVARRHGAWVHCDAVQAAGKIPLSMADLGADMLSVSAHKLGGPQGVGALVVRDGLSLAPMLRGGGQERRRRAGTENVAGIAGFGAAATAAAAGLRHFADLAPWRDRFEASVVHACPDAVLVGAGAARVANTSCIAMPGVRADTQLMGFDLAGVAVSAGAACSSGKVATSHVLLAMGAAEWVAENAIRISLGWTTEEVDIDRLIQAWIGVQGRAGAKRAPAAAPA